jgi:hypothetical protein
MSVEMKMAIDEIKLFIIRIIRNFLIRPVGKRYFNFYQNEAIMNSIETTDVLFNVPDDKFRVDLRENSIDNIFL